MTIGNRGLYGQPILPYAKTQAYAGSDVFIPMTFLDHTKTAQVPTSITYELDDLTNDVNMIASTTVTTGLTNPYTLQLPASAMQMSLSWQGSQFCQLWVTAVIPNGSGTETIQGVCIIELCAIQTPSGSNTPF